MNSLKTIVLFLFFTSITFAQSPSINDTIIASQYFKKADALLNDRKLDSTIVYFKKALPIYEKTKAWERLASCHNGISETYFEYSKYEESLKYAKSALEISNKHLDTNNLELANSLDNMGHYYLKKVDLNTAKSYFEKALIIKTYKENIIGVSTSYNNLGQIYIRKNEFVKASEQFYKAIDADSTSSNPNLAFSYNNLARIFYIKADYEESIKFMKKAILIESSELGDDHPKVGGYYNNIGTIYERLDEDDKALLHYRRALDIQLKNSGENHENIASYYNNISRIFDKKGDIQSAISYLEKCITIRLFLHGENHPSLAVAYSNISGKYSKQGKYLKGLLYAKKALTIYSSFYKQDHKKTAVAYNNIAVRYINIGDLDKALVNLEKAFHINKKLFGKNHSTIAKNCTNFGEIYMLKGDLKKSLAYHKKSENIYIKIFGDNNTPLAYNFTKLGDVFLKKKKYDSALFYQNKALHIYRNKLSENNYRVLNIYNQIAATYSEKKEYRKAIEHYNKVLDLQNNYELKPDLRKNTDFLISNVLLDSYEGKAKNLKELFLKEKEIESLKKSVKHYEEAENIIASIRNASSNHKDKLLFSKKIKKSYQGAIESYLLLSKEENSNDIRNQSFHYSEKSKATTLKELLNESEAKNFSGLPDDLIRLEKKLRINKAYYKSKITEELSSKKLDSKRMSDYENKLFNTSKKQDSLTAVLEKNYPKYYELKYNNEVISVTEVQQKLDDKTTLLEFFTGDSITYAFTISKNKIAVKELPTPKLEEQLERFQNSITKNEEEHKAISHQLYQQLIAPVKDQLIGNQLIIVPDGELWHLNFDLLHTREDTSNNPKTWPYLLKEYAISYGNSATLLFGKDTTTNGKNSSKKDQECLAFSFSGDSDASKTTTLNLHTLRSSSIDLPGTREEIKAIANIVDGQYFYGGSATEQNFKKFAGDYNVLHLAIHGNVDNERPENSKLYFTKSKDTIEDNFLYGHELFALDIPAELAVLSACNTGTGKIAKGEGIMSLGTAFQYAGTKSLVLTNWAVSDETTPKIMEYFYTHLKEGKNKATALQEAKLQFLATANEEVNHPYYWGGFYLLGDTTPIQFQDTNYIYWALGLGILGLIAIGLFWYRKKKST